MHRDEGTPGRLRRGWAGGDRELGETTLVMSSEDRSEDRGFEEGRGREGCGSYPVQW